MASERLHPRTGHPQAGWVRRLEQTCLCFECIANAKAVLDGIRQAIYGADPLYQAKGQPTDAERFAAVYSDPDEVARGERIARS